MSSQGRSEHRSGVTITGQWRDLLTREVVEDWTRRADDVYNDRTRGVFPRSRADVFRAFAECELDSLKVVILGLEPYGSADADGLAFSTSQRGNVPSSLWIIFSRIALDTRVDVDYTNGDLSRWARCGVLLLNSNLTIGHGNDVQWGDFTNDVIRKISEERNRVVFMLWGGKAIERGQHIVNGGRHLILKSSHPSPKSAFNRVGDEVPFAHCRHFSEANEFLGDRAVDWR